MKTCTKCGVEKELGEFYKERGCSDGHRGSCKNCVKEYKARYREANKEKTAARAKIYYEANAAKIKTRAKEWGKTNNGRMVTRKMAYYKANRESILAKAKIAAHRRLYNLREGEREEMIDMQGGCCIMCNTALEVDRPNKVHVDHCHDTGEVRGIMCQDCNHAEGKLRRIAKRLDMTFSQVCDRMKEYSTQYITGIEDVL